MLACMQNKTVNIRKSGNQIRQGKTSHKCIGVGNGIGINTKGAGDDDPSGFRMGGHGVSLKYYHILQCTGI